MVIKKVSYKNEIMEVHYDVERKEGKPVEMTMRCGDKPLPRFLTLLMLFRDCVLDLLELPKDDDEAKRITVNQVTFDYTGEQNIMGAVISAKRKLNHSSGIMALNTPHKFAKTTSKSGKGSSTMVFDKPVVDLLLELLDETEKYINGERSQTELFDKKAAEQTTSPEPAAETKKKRKTSESSENKFQEKLSEAKKDASRSKKKFHINPTGPEDQNFAVKSKGKYISIGAGYATRLTAMISQSEVLQDSIHEGMLEMGYAGNKLLFERDGGLLQIHSAVVDYKQVTNDELAKNVIEELIDDFSSQPTLRFVPGSQVKGLEAVSAQA